MRHIIIKINILVIWLKSHSKLFLSTHSIIFKSIYKIFKNHLDLYLYPILLMSYSLRMLIKNLPLKFLAYLIVSNNNLNFLKMLQQ